MGAEPVVMAWESPRLRLTFLLNLHMATQVLSLSPYPERNPTPAALPQPTDTSFASFKTYTPPMLPQERSL